MNAGRTPLGPHVHAAASANPRRSVAAGLRVHERPPTCCRVRLPSFAPVVSVLSHPDRNQVFSNAQKPDDGFVGAGLRKTSQFIRAVYLDTIERPHMWHRTGMLMVHKSCAAMGYPVATSVHLMLGC